MAAARNVALDQLRGIAALMVCIYHLSVFLPAPVRAVVQIGDTGVQVFFVISGYIIPYSMARGGYRLQDIGRFWLKRLVRLHPTYVVALVFTLAISWAAAKARGDAFDTSWSQAVQGFFYLWLPPENPVFWTLVVELQYYALVSLCFPWLFSPRRRVRLAAFAAGAVAVLLLEPQVPVLRHLPFFLLGFVACHGALWPQGRWEASALLALAVAAAWPSATVMQVAAGLACWAAIVWMPPLRWRGFSMLGAISYSLYVIHFPLGVKLVNLAAPRTPAGLQFIWTPIGVAVCLAVAWAIYRLVEKPSGEMSQRIPLSPGRGRRAAEAASPMQ